MKEFKFKGYKLYYIGKESSNRDWYHCILVNKYNEVEIVLDYVLDEDGLRNIRTTPIDCLIWNISNLTTYEKDILNQCDITMGNIIEKLGDFKKWEQ